MAIAKDGTHVEILGENERWYRVRSEEGVEAWIYKSLVVLEPVSLKDPSVPTALAPLDIMDILSPSTAKPDDPAESRPEKTSGQEGSGISPAAPVEERRSPSEAMGIGWFNEAIAPHVQGLGVYVIIALIVVLVLSIALQLRAARQLRRAMQEMGQILDIVEKMYTDGALARTGNRGVPTNSMPAEHPINQLQRLGIEFSPIERAVLDALSDQREVQEGELEKTLDEKAFAGVLIKAVIDDIIRKTKTAGLPWVEVRYSQGQYSYQLRPEVVSRFSKHRGERP